MEYRIIDTRHVLYSEVLALRQRVLRAPLGLDIMNDDLSDEPHQIIGIALSEYNVVACLMAKSLPHCTWKLRQMAVALPYQQQGIGAALMVFMEHEACKQGIGVIELHARETAVGFYEKLGYAVSGEQFKEVGIPHWFMLKNMNR
jgi:GNAT superfamily N-acetyltransferase